MKLSTTFCILGIVGGLGVMVGAFLNQSSPYVTVREAKKMKNDHLHLLGEIVDGTFQVNPGLSSIHFLLKDPEGVTVPVVFKGTPPANMGGVTKVVAVGGFKEGAFQAHKLLYKCPSKYESVRQVQARL
jgi:cytochrome c-type biogenesis protein CcmE